MTDEQIIKAWDILAKLDFFGGQRAGRELWNEKPVDIQNEDIENFKKDIAFLKEFINRQKAEIEDLYKTLDYEIIELHAMRELADGLKAEVEFLKQDALTPDVIKIGDEVARRGKIKAEAIKEFAERVKREVIVIGDIDTLVKETVGDNDAD